VRYAFVARERAHYPLDLLCRLLDVARSGFYDFERRQAKPPPDADATLRRDLRACHTASRGAYGRPRLVCDLRALGHPVGPKRVARVMREEGLRGRSKGRARPRTTDGRHGRPVAENLLERRFEVDSPVAAWVSDITCIDTCEGWLYLAVVLSVQTRQVLGYSLAERMPDDLVEHALLNAWHRRPAGRGVLFHSDRGSQYASRDFRRTIGELGFVQSMSRKGNCWDNAVAESFFATLKNEEATARYPTKAADLSGILWARHIMRNQGHEYAKEEADRRLSGSGPRAAA
jgi:transposase InsO family protein